MSLRNRIANTIDNQYAVHPTAAAMREQLDAAGVAPLAGDKHGTGQAIIDARQEERRRQIEAGEALVRMPLCMPHT